MRALGRGTKIRKHPIRALNLWFVHCQLMFFLVLAVGFLSWPSLVVSQTNPESEVLAANAAFYRAFADGDRQKMDELWSRRFPVTVIHPTWPGIYGREAVMQSWNQLLRVRVNIRVAEAQAFVVRDSAFVICYEILDGGTILIATNIFSREGDTWKLVHHQAGSTTHVPETGISI